MKKIVLVFPGQGSQFVGMGKNFEKPILNNSYLKADEVLGYKLSEICFEGPMDELKLTANTQPAILSHSFASFQVIQNILEKYHAKIDLVLGHSVGEYGALVASGVLSFEDAIKAVHLRGKYMQDAVPVGQGKMYAVLRISSEEVAKICKEVSHENHQVVPANFNDPEQTVISGHSAACDEAVEKIKTLPNSKARAMELPVSAPFHSPLMSPAREKLSEHFKTVLFRPNRVPYIANIDHKFYPENSEPSVIRENLIKQVDGSVHWLQSITQLDAANTLFIEVGPGKILKGLIKKIHSDAKIFCSDDLQDIQSLETELKNLN